MKTGRLLKFKHPAGALQAYLYREGNTCKAVVYALAGERAKDHEPLLTLTGDDEAEVEARLRAWVAGQRP